MTPPPPSPPRSGSLQPPPATPPVAFKPPLDDLSIGLRGFVGCFLLLQIATMLDLETNRL
jgi:hypothetical protein